MTTKRSDSAFDMPKIYDPAAAEERWYSFWRDRDLFKPTGDASRKPFVIVLPPPNVTGELHLGHAMYVVEDIMVRWHRMLGDPTLWVPGVDHAGIAGQTAVEAEIAKEGLTRQDLGREKFLERVWQWMNTYRHVIGGQMSRLGFSLDWSRNRFTMDEGPILAVRTTFVNLYKKGRIYRGERLINWCPRCRTALSDLEVDYEDANGSLWHIRYPIEGETDRFVTIATTRPETMVADTAIAVHPDDERYRDLVGKHVRLPLIGRSLPIIADEASDPAVGTGALKVTPAHDPTDFDIGRRHDLPMINGMNLDASLSEVAGPYAGMDRFEARDRIVADLEKEGLLAQTEDHVHSVGHCSRCHTIVEPLISNQWFIDILPLAKPAIDAVKSGQIKILPARFEKDYFNWMENIRDWCISRQLWWGHRIPVWYCPNGHETVELEDPTACAECGSTEIEQDPDVLDTWFSSGLWPHSILGWPEETDDLRRFYPGTVMETGYDILFFWVARMIMLGIENTGKIPFEVVYLHGLVRDERGQKMSKSKGNVINPIEAMGQYGTDALRYSLVSGSTPGQDQKLSPQRMEAARNFANKLWNASRYVMMQEWDGELGSSAPIPGRDAPLEDRWIVSRLHKTTETVGDLLENYQFGEAGRSIYEFLWGEYCDWYIELSKVRLKESGRDGSPLPILLHVLESSLRLLQPFMPFITEELWRRLRDRFGDDGRAESIMVASFPLADPAARDTEAEAEMDRISGLVRAIRNIRAEYNVDPKRWIEATVEAGDKFKSIGHARPAIEALARVRPLTIEENLDGTPGDAVAVAVAVHGMTVYLPLGGMVDVEAERARSRKELADVAAEIERLGSKLNNAGFINKAPPNVVERERRRYVELSERRSQIQKLLDRLG